MCVCGGGGQLCWLDRQSSQHRQAGWVAGTDELVSMGRPVDHRHVVGAGPSMIDKPASPRAGIDERACSHMHTKASFWPHVVPRDTERRRKQVGICACVCGFGVQGERVGVFAGFSCSRLMDWAGCGWPAGYGRDHSAWKPGEVPNGSCPALP